ncbi:unnamed protein product [Discosporangium mesarthrocarpum]
MVRGKEERVPWEGCLPSASGLWVCGFRGSRVQCTFTQCTCLESFQRGVAVHDGRGNLAVDGGWVRFVSCHQIHFEVLQYVLQIFSRVFTLAESRLISEPKG